MGLCKYNTRYLTKCLSLRQRSGGAGSGGIICFTAWKDDDKEICSEGHVVVSQQRKQQEGEDENVKRGNGIKDQHTASRTRHSEVEDVQFSVHRKPGVIETSPPPVCVRSE